MAEINEQKIREFIEFSGCPPTEARSYLEMAGGNVEEATNLFFEMGSSGSGGPPAQQGSRNEDGEYVRDAMRTGYQSQMIDEEEPPEVKRRRMNQAIERDSMTMKSRMEFDRPHQVAHGVGSAGGHTGEALNKMFKQPEYNDPAPWMSVMEKSKTQGLYILVNIQQAEVFDSHRLNRDVWGDDTIKDIVTESFTFWQRDNKSIEGEQFVQYHNCLHQLPIVCIVDPRTGRRVKSWEAKKWKDASISGNFLFDFLDRFPMPKPVAAPAPIPDSTPTSASTDEAKSSQPAPTAAETPANAAAPATTPASAPVAASTTQEAAASTDKPEAEEKKPAEAEPPAAMPEEPAEGAGVVKVSLRTPDGKRVMRRFLAADPVEQMFVVASALTQQPVRLIDLSTQFPKRSLRDGDGALQVTIGDAKVAGNMLLVNVRAA